MFSPEARRSSSRETKTGLLTAAAMALLGAACERIPPTPATYGTPLERIRATGSPRTPEVVLATNLPRPDEHAADRAAVEISSLSFQVDPRSETNVGRLDRLAVTYYGAQIKASGTTQRVENGVNMTYSNHNIIPFPAAPLTDIEHHRVELQYDYTRTDVVAGNLSEQDYAHNRAVISQRTTLRVLPGAPEPMGPAPSLQQTVAIADTPTAAIGEALNKIIAPPERAGEIETDFARQRAEGAARHDLNRGAVCGMITSPDMPDTYYCDTHTRREQTLVIDGIQVENVQVEGPNNTITIAGVRAYVLYHDGTTAGH